jgi:spore germination protein YaaH
LAPFGVVVGAACGAAAEPTLQIGAWVTYWDFDRGRERLARAPALFDDVFYFVADLDAEGRPVLARPELGPQLSSKASAQPRRRSWLTVVNDRRPARGAPAILKDAAGVHRMLVDPGERAAHRRALVELASLHGFGGVDIDYENLLPEDRDAFSTFARELAGELAARGLRLSVTVQPKRAESRSVGPGAADWAALCQASDRVQVMLYNLHNAKTGPGPVATPGWIREVLAFASSQCPKERIVPILKVSGMDWGGGGARELQHVDAVALLAADAGAVEREGEGATPYFRYSASDGPHTVFYEDAQSILRKISVLEELGYDRVVLWSLGREDPQLITQLLMRKGLAPSALTNDEPLPNDRADASKRCPSDAVPNPESSDVPFRADRSRDRPAVPRLAGIQGFRHGGGPRDLALPLYVRHHRLPRRGGEHGPELEPVLLAQLRRPPLPRRPGSDRARSAAGQRLLAARLRREQPGRHRQRLSPAEHLPPGDPQPLG